MASSTRSRESAARSSMSDASGTSSSASTPSSSATRWRRSGSLPARGGAGMEGGAMEWLNYHHLLYFWVVACHGSVTRAAAELRLAQPTVSTQLRTLENMLGEKLFARTGRRLVLTDVGRLVFRYADEIFGLGRELLETVKGRPTGQPMRLTVGIADAVPKLIAYRLLRPALAVAEPVR